MDRLVAGIVNLSPPLDSPQDESGHRNLLKDLKLALPDVKNANANDVETALARLSPGHHSVGFASVLALGVVGDTFGGDERLLQRVAQWMLECNAQAIKCNTDEVAIITRAFAAEGEASPERAKATLQPLRVLLDKYRPSEEHMTPVHAALLKSSLLANHCAIGYAVLQTKPYQLGDTSLSATDYLLYFYYGGLVCIGCRKLAQASELLLLAITMPTQVPDAIILSAWQKYVMVHALQAGEHPEVPKHTPHHSFRILREQAPLRRLVTAYSSGNRAAMASTLDKEGKWFADAGLTGLAQQLLAKVVTRKIQHLTATYRTLALADIAREAGLESAAAAQQHILKMIADGEMAAKIDEVAGMVRFEEDAPDDSSALLAAIQEKSGVIIDLQRRLKGAAQEATLEPKYVQKVLAQKRQQVHRSSLAGAPARVTGEME